MGWFGDDSDQAQAYNQVQGNQASLSHEVIAGAAAYEAAKAYENHVSANGQPATHKEAKELLAGFSGAFVDREAETRGADAFDSYEAKRSAEQQATSQLDPNQW